MKDKELLASKINKLESNLRMAEDENFNLKNKFKKDEIRYKEAIDSLTKEKEELSKLVLNSKKKVSQFEHDLKRLQSENLELNNKLKKQIGDKNTKFCNNFEVKSLIDFHEEFDYNSDIEYLISNKLNIQYHTIHKRLLEENRMLRENLIEIHKDIINVVELRKEFLLQKKKLEFIEGNEEQRSLEEFDQLLFLNQQDLEKPSEMGGNEALENFRENIKKFKELIKDYEERQKEFFSLDESELIDKIPCIRDLKKIIENYKAVVSAQDSIINKAITRRENEEDAKEIFDRITKNHKILNDKEIEKARSLLIDQKSKLDNYNSKMDKNRDLMDAFLNKMNEEKMEITKFSENFTQKSKISKDKLERLVKSNASNIDNLLNML